MWMFLQRNIFSLLWESKRCAGSKTGKVIPIPGEDYTWGHWTWQNLACYTWEMENGEINRSCRLVGLKNLLKNMWLFPDEAGGGKQVMATSGGYRNQTRMVRADTISIRQEAMAVSLFSLSPNTIWWSSQRVNHTTTPVFKSQSTFYTVIYYQHCMMKLTLTYVLGI